MDNWTDAKVSVNGTALHYVRTGGNKPPLVLIHGFTDSAANFRLFARDLEADYDVIMVDTRGHGESDPAPNTFTLEQQAHEVAGLIQQLGLTRVGVLGHSMGAATAVEMAALYPDLIAYVVIEDPPLLTPETQPDFSGWKASVAAIKASSPEDRLAGARAHLSRWLPEEVPAWVESKVQVDLGVFETPLLLKHVDWRPVVKQVKAPGMLITGDPERGAIVTARLAREMKQLWQPGLTVVHVPGAGHNIRRDEPEAYLFAVRPFLAQHAQAT